MGSEGKENIRMHPVSFVHTTRPQRSSGFNRALCYVHATRHFSTVALAISNSFSLVTSSGDAMRCDAPHRKFHQSPRSRASSRSEETYSGALDAKKSTAVLRSIRLVRAAPRYRDDVVLVSFSPGGGVVRNGKGKLKFFFGMLRKKKRHELP
jgi:hypothetical protein